MAQVGRDFFVNGESLIRVKFGAHVLTDTGVFGLLTNGGTSQSNLSDLGLCEDRVVITPTYYHRDVFVDDFGPNCPVEVQVLLAEINIRMRLIHYDANILDACLAESQGVDAYRNQAGVFVGAGSFLGHGRPLQASGNHYISLNILSPQRNIPWRFLASYMPRQPVVLPLGTEKTTADVNFRCIAYQVPYASGTLNILGQDIGNEIASSGTILFDHNLDT